MHEGATSFTVTGNRTPPDGISEMRRAVWEYMKYEIYSYRKFEQIFVLLQVHKAIRADMSFEQITEVLMDFDNGWFANYPGDASDFKECPPPMYAYSLDRERLQIHSLMMHLDGEGLV